MREDWTRAHWLAADPTQDPDESAREAAERVVAAAASAHALFPSLPMEEHPRGGCFLASRLHPWSAHTAAVRTNSAV